MVNKDSWSDLLENAPSHHGFLFFFHRWQISFEGFGFKVTKWLCVFSSCWAQGTLFLLVIPMPAPETREADPVAVDVAETDAKPLTKDVTGP